MAADRPRARQLSPGRVLRDAATGSVIATLAAVAAHALGLPQLIRVPDIILFLPAAILGAAIGATRLRPLLWYAAVPLAILSIVVAYTPLVGMLADGAVRRDRVPERVDAIAVLSNGITSGGQMRGKTLDGFLGGLALARRGVAPAVMVSREHSMRNGRAVSDSADQQDILRLLDFPVEIVYADSVDNTRTEALAMRRIARGRGWNRIAVVTSPIHSRRACATFEAAGFEVICAPSVARDMAMPGIRDAEDRLRAFRAWVYEMFAGATYRSRGWTK